MRDDQIKAGDVLRIREWDDMAGEFPVSHGDICVSGSAGFLKQMKYMCGAVFTVSECYETLGDSEKFYRSCEGVEDRPDGVIQKYWYITAGMLEPFVGYPELEVPDEDEFESILNSCIMKGGSV